MGYLFLVLAECNGRGQRGKPPLASGSNTSIYRVWRQNPSFGRVEPVRGALSRATRQGAVGPLGATALHGGGFEHHSVCTVRVLVDFQFSEHVVNSGLELFGHGTSFLTVAHDVRRDHDDEFDA